MGAFTFLDDEQTEKPGGSFTFLDDGAESGGGSVTSTVKNYGLGLVAGAGEGVANTEAAIGTFLQAPAANTLSGVLGARALAGRGITAAMNAVSALSAPANSARTAPTAALNAAPRAAAAAAAATAPSAKAVKHVRTATPASPAPRSTSSTAATTRPKSRAPRVHAVNPGRPRRRLCPHQRPARG